MWNNARSLLMLLVLSSVALKGAPVLAQSAVLFARADIVVHPNNAPAKPGEVTISRPPVSYNIEVRSGDALKLDYIHTLNILTDKDGVMIALDRPADLDLPHMQVSTPVDVLFVQEDGTILETLAGAVLANVGQKITAKSPVKALLFLKNGQLATHNIKPRDVITGTMFTPAPPVQE